MRRLVLLVAAAAAGITVAPAFGSPAQPDRGSYAVTAYPMPQRTYYPAGQYAGTPYCMDDGVEGLQKVSRRFHAPTVGMLTMRLPGFSGDWDIAVFDEHGKRLGAGGWNDQVMGGPAGEIVTTRLTAGQDAVMVACNNASTQTTVRVSYAFTRGLDVARTLPTPGFRHLAAGRPTDLRERVPVNVVFLGFSRAAVPPAKFRSRLPAISRPHVRAPYYSYGYDRPLGITYRYDYRLTYARNDYQDAFFRYLVSIATRLSTTADQDAYNAQKKRRLTITSNYGIDATAVERWLALHPPAGVDTRRDTVFYINWFGRKDFRFHIYRKTDEPLSDTGLSLGRDDMNALTAWGGTPPDDPESGYHATRRIWFYDLSAGPTYWTHNAVVDSKDSDGDGIPDYDIPPSWEYGSFRDAGELVDDLATVTRYVAVNLLFTPSPLYDPAITAPALPGTLSVATNLLTLGTTSDLRSYFDPKAFSASLRGVSPLFRGVGVATPGATSGRWAACFVAYLASYGGPSCESPAYTDWANPYVATATDRAIAVSAAPPADYRTAIQVYVPRDDTAELAGHLGCYAYADDNQRDGTQSFVQAQVTSACAQYVGLTDLLIHEFGHHLGLAHPHDGYDYIDGKDYSSYDPQFAFAAVGDEVNSRMSYLWLNNEFSQFDRDNMHRWLTAAYLGQTNALLAKVVSADRFRSELARIDDLAGRASAAFTAHRYADASTAAAEAYAGLRAILRAEGVPVPASAKGYTLDGARTPIGGGVAERQRASYDYLTTTGSGMCAPIAASLARPECGLPASLGASTR